MKRSVRVHPVHNGAQVLLSLEPLADLLVRASSQRGTLSSEEIVRTSTPPSQRMIGMPTKMWVYFPLVRDIPITYLS